MIQVLLGAMGWMAHAPVNVSLGPQLIFPPSNWNAFFNVVFAS